MRVQVLRQFLNEGEVVAEGQMIRISDARARVLMECGMVNLPGVNQDPAELLRFLDFVREIGALRYLEIGCRNGDTFYAVMRVIGPGGYGLAVDLPENDDSRQSLLGTASELASAGIHTEVRHGDSGDPSVINMVRQRAPFDLILIDADHRYEGVKRDFETYRGFAPVVALHDVTAPDGHQSDGYDNGVGRFWREINGGSRHLEFVTPGSLMGFGVLFIGEAP